MSINIKLLKQTNGIVTGISKIKAFKNMHKISLMRYHGTIKGFVYK